MSRCESLSPVDVRGYPFRLAALLMGRGRFQASRNPVPSRVDGDRQLSHADRQRFAVTEDYTYNGLSAKTLKRRTVIE